MKGKQAKTVSPIQERALLGYLARIVKKSEHIALQEVTNPPCLTPRLDFHHSMAHTPHQYEKSQRR